MRISDWSSDVCSSDLSAAPQPSAGALTAHDSDRSARRRPGLQSSSHLADDLGSNSLASHLAIEAGPATTRVLRTSLRLAPTLLAARGPDICAGPPAPAPCRFLLTYKSFPHTYALPV